MPALTLQAVGDEVGVVFPVELLEALQVTEGDVLHVTCRPGSITLIKYDSEFQMQMEVVRRVMREQRKVLRELTE